MQFYSNLERERDTYALPDCEVFQLTAREAAEQDEERIYEYMKRHEYRLASMNSATREKMFNAMIEDESIAGGWFYWFCFPGCMPEGSAMGPYATRDEAINAARESVSK